MELKCTDCMVTFQAPYDKDCPFCGTDAFVVELSNNTEKLEKKLATAVKALEEIRGMAINNYHDTRMNIVGGKAREALAEIGGEDE